MADYNRSTSNPHDYWAQPVRADKTRADLEFVQQYAARFVASLEPVARLLVVEEVPKGSVRITPPFNFQQLGFKRPDLLVYAALDDRVKALTDGLGYLGIVSGTQNFEPHGLQGASLMIARGNVDDTRNPAEYAQVALGMPADVMISSNFGLTWLPRLSQQPTA